MINIPGFDRKGLAAGNICMWKQKEKTYRSFGLVTLLLSDEPSITE